MNVCFFFLSFAFVSNLSAGNTAAPCQTHPARQHQPGGGTKVHHAAKLGPAVRGKAGRTSARLHAQRSGGSSHLLLQRPADRQSGGLRGGRVRGEAVPRAGRLGCNFLPMDRMALYVGTELIYTWQIMQEAGTHN